jgi:hypothetical protein
MFGKCVGYADIIVHFGRFGGRGCAAIPCTVGWKEIKEEEKPRKHRTYIGAKCNIIERWF